MEGITYNVKKKSKYQIQTKILNTSSKNLEEACRKIILNFGNKKSILDGQNTVKNASTKKTILCGQDCTKKYFEYSDNFTLTFNILFQCWI